jgi:hypothetical protein
MILASTKWPARQHPTAPLPVVQVNFGHLRCIWSKGQISERQKWPEMFIVTGSQSTIFLKTPELPHPGSRHSESQEYGGIGALRLLSDGIFVSLIGHPVSRMGVEQLKHETGDSTTSF